MSPPGRAVAACRHIARLPTPPAPAMRQAQGGGCERSRAAYGRDRPRERQVPVPFAAAAQITRVLVWLEFWLNENGCRFSNLEIWPEEPKGGTR